MVLNSNSRLEKSGYLIIMGKWIETMLKYLLKKQKRNKDVIKNVGKDEKVKIT